MKKLVFLSLIFVISSCTSAEIQTPQSQIVKVYATPAARPWLTELFDCAADASAVISMTDPDSASILLRIGEPENLTTPAYQIDTEEILIVTHRESPVQNLTLEEARALFGGRGDPSVQVWVYASGEDVQEVFDQFVMSGGSVTSLARLAVSPQQMSDVLNAEKNAVGILPRHWKIGDTHDVFTIASVPVLAILK